MLSRLIVLFALCASVVVARRVHENYHTILQRRFELGLQQRPAASDNVTSHYMVQPLDHFDRYNTGNYTQSYWLNEQFLDVNRPTGFIFLGGEWQESGATLEYGSNIMSSWAETFKGLMLNIQHRYYDGQNPPAQDGVAADVRYLNSEQALADAARIVAAVNEMYRSKVKQPIKWVVTSGSYGGIMAATFRLRYPELTVGAVAISAPVQAIVDYTGFFEVDGRNLNESSPSCLNTTRQAMAALDALLDDPKNGWAQVNKDFQTNIKTQLDMEQWLFSSVVWEVSAGSVCSQSIADPYKALVAATSPGANATYDASNVYETYTWLWFSQTCTEWGFWQTGTDAAKNPLQPVSRHMTPHLFLQACKDTLGYSFEQTAENIRWTNVAYGGKNFTTTNTFFSNGNADSWSAAGITAHVPRVSGNSIFIIDEGTHCSDLYWPNDGDSDSLKAARAAEVNAIKAWLSA